MRLARTLPGFFAVLFLLSSLASDEPAPDRWRRLGPYGGSVLQLEQHPAIPNMLFAAGSYFTYRSSNGGRSWDRMEPQSRCILRVHPEQPNYLFAVCSEFVYFSANSGETWLFASRRPYGGSNYDVELDPLNPAIVYLATAPEFSGNNRYFYRSNDFGRTWKQKIGGIPPGVLRAQVELDPTDPKRLYLLADDGLFVSTNGAESWSPRKSNISTASNNRVPLLKIDPFDPSTLYLLERSRLVKSVDGGKSWSVLRSAVGSPTSLWLGPKHGQILYGEHSSLYESLNGGVSWSTIPLWQSPAGGSILETAAVDRHNPGRIFLSIPAAGLLKTETSGRSWQKVASGLQELHPYFVEIADRQPLTILAPISTRWDHLAQSVNGGATWKILNNIRYDYALAIHPRNGNMWAADSLNRLAITQNAGKQWTFRPFPENMSPAWLEFDPFNTSTLFGAAWESVIKTTDLGASWTRQQSGLGKDLWIVRADPGRQHYMYAANRSDLFRTSNGGDSWSRVSGVTCGNNWITSLSVDPFDSKNVLYSTRRSAVGVKCNHIFRSTNGGDSWAPLDSPATYGGVYQIYFDPVRQNTIFFVAEYGGIYVSRDSGLTWSVYNLKSSGRIFWLAFSRLQPSLLFGASSEGIVSFRRASSTGMRLEQMSPNPVRTGAEVRLLGSGFGTSGQLYLGPNRLNAKSWSDSEIRFAVPSQARTASIKIVRGNASVAQELLISGGGSVYPTNGPSSGGTRVILRAHRVYDSTVQVFFGSRVSPIAQPISLHFQYTAEGETIILATSPPGAGSVNVFVADIFGPHKVGRFTYVN